ncbi:HAD family hydrolase [Oryzobacter telluris]|uniref:HAD family hydrolase n=1 Tax=Oryzobacter telluris TaxID=3149179 RepID=UPI00370D72A8
MTALRVSALLLDLDGTLVDSESIHREGFARWFTARGWEYTDDVAALFIGRRADDVFATVDGPWRGLNPQVLFAEAVAAMPDDRLPDPVPGALEVLDLASARGIPVALVTSANTAWATKALDQLGGLGRFDAAVTRDDIELGKPDPACYRRGCELLGVDPAGALACEDAPNGVLAAVGAGVGSVVGITTTFAGVHLEAAGATSTAPDLTHLAAQLHHP